MMKIGDKVRFLNESGGGRVSGFQGKDIVLVEDEDGFDVPMRIKDVVVIGEEDYDTRHVVEAKAKAATAQHAPAPEVPKEVTFKAPPQERKGGDALSAYLAFVPIDVKELMQTRFETYFVNDSNYYIRFAYLSAEGAGWRLRATAEVEPNTKLFVEEFGRESLNELNKVCLQLISYKRDKPFLPRPLVDVQLRIDGVKFYKLHTFQDSPFFEQPSLVYTLVENDKPARSLVIDAQQLKESMYHKPEEKPVRPLTSPARRETDDPNTLVVDLHADEILETTQGMSAVDVLNYQLDVFRKTLAQHAKHRNMKIIFIHGKGEGVLRRAIINELQYRYKQYHHQDASFQEYGYGATQVTIK